jgi:hypothetical protein
MLAWPRARPPATCTVITTTRVASMTSRSCRYDAIAVSGKEAEPALKTLDAKMAIYIYTYIHIYIYIYIYFYIYIYIYV